MTVYISTMSGVPRQAAKVGAFFAPCMLVGALLGCDQAFESGEVAERAPSPARSLEQGAPPVAVPVRIRGVTAIGPLCAKLLGNVTAGRADAVSVLIDSNVESAGIAKSATCTIAAELDVPRGMQFQGARVAWQGYAMGISMKARVQASLYYGGATEIAAPRDLFAKRLGESLDSWVVNQVLEAWSPCSGTSGTVTLKTDILADLLPDPGGKDAFGVVAVDSFHLSLLSDTSAIILRACAGPR